MTFTQAVNSSVNKPRVLVEIDFSTTTNEQWINAGSGIWKVNFNNSYPEVDSELLDGFTAQTIPIIGSMKSDGTPLSKMPSLAAMTTTECYYYDSSTKTLYVIVQNYDDPILHTVTLGVSYGFSDVEFTPIGADQLYKGRLSSLPSFGLVRDPMFFGKISYASVTLSIINVDGEYDTFNDVYDIYGTPVRIYYGFENVAHSEYQLMYSGYLSSLVISENELQIQITDARKQLSKKVEYNCTAKNALDAIYDLLALVYTNIQYSQAFFNTTEWDYARAGVGTVTISTNIGQPQEVISYIEEICASAFGSFIVEPEGTFTFKLIDTGAAATASISKYDILSELSVSYDPSEVLSSVRVSYAKDGLGSTNDYKTWLTDTSLEASVVAIYKTYIQQDFNTVLSTQNEAQALATNLLDYFSSIHGRLSITVPMKYYSLPLSGIVDVELERENSTFIGIQTCEILGKTYDLNNNTINLDLRIISLSILYDRITSDGSTRMTVDGFTRRVL